MSQRQPFDSLCTVAAPNEYQLGLLAFTDSHDHRTLDVGAASSFPDLAVDVSEGQRLAFKLVEDLPSVLDHADDRDMAHQRPHYCGKAEPGIHEKVFGRDAKSQGSSYHGDYQFSRFTDRFLPSSGPTCPSVHLLRDSLNPILLLGRTQHRVV